MSASANVQELFNQALERVRRDELDAAAEALERVLQLDPEHAAGHYQMGNVRRDQGRHADAERHFLRAVALSPQHAQAHNNLGVIHELAGRAEPAIASYRRAVQADPALAQAYLNLGRLLMQIGRRDEAADCYRLAVTASDKPAIFVHLLAALDGRSTAAAPAEYVRSTFDAFARDFDERLIGHFDYRVPQAMAQAIARVRRFEPASVDVLDLGCGTGLCGAALAPVARRLVGVDLSASMLHEAGARGCYHELVEADVLAWLREAKARQFDVILAADVFIYIGDLAPVFAEAKRLLRPGGVLAFSIEVCTDAPWRLQDSGRYAQSAQYIERLASEHDFSVALRETQPIRKPIVGLLYVLTAIKNLSGAAPPGGP